MFGERIQLSSPLAFGNVHPFTFRASIPLSVVFFGMYKLFTNHLPNILNEWKVYVLLRVFSQVVPSLQYRTRICLPPPPFWCTSPPATLCVFMPGCYDNWQCIVVCNVPSHIWISSHIHWSMLLLLDSSWFFSQNFHFSIECRCVKRNRLVRNVVSGIYICIALSTVNHGTDD